MAAKDYFEDMNTGDEIIKSLKDCITYEKGDTSKARKTVLRVSSPHNHFDMFSLLQDNLSYASKIPFDKG